MGKWNHSNGRLASSLAAILIVKHKQVFVSILFVLFVCMSAFAQLSGSVSLGSALNLGNLNSINAFVQSSLNGDSGKFNWSVAPSFLITMIKRGDRFEMFERESYLTASFSGRYGKWKLIGFSDAENSYLRKTLVRFSGGVGGGYDLLDKSGWKISFSEVFMPEIYLSDDRSKDRPFSLRMSSRLKIKYNGRVNFESISFFQPSIWTTGNVRFVDNINFRSTNNLDFPIYKKLSLGIQAMIQVFTLPTYLDRTVGMYDSRISLLFKASF